MKRLLRDLNLTVKQTIETVSSESIMYKCDFKGKKRESSRLF